MGAAIYVTAHVTGFSRNQLPDALWAWALFSCLLIIWNRRITVWIIAAFVLCTLFEILQHYQWIPGTGDYFDVMVYGISGTLALLTNKYFSILFNNNYDHKH
jgi:hypothetical protein